LHPAAAECWRIRASGSTHESTRRPGIDSSSTGNTIANHDQEIDMEQILINLIAGALGGVGAGKSSPKFDLGMIGNIISGLVGGGVLGQVLTALLPSIMAAAQAGNLSIGGIISHAIAGGAGGAILTAIIGAIKNKAAA
jgi:hypothetical protein